MFTQTKVSEIPNQQLDFDDSPPFHNIMPFTGESVMNSKKSPYKLTIRPLSQVVDDQPESFLKLSIDLSAFHACAATNAKVRMSSFEMVPSSLYRS